MGLRVKCSCYTPEYCQWDCMSNVHAIHLSIANGTACQTFVLYAWVLPMGLRVKRSCNTHEYCQWDCVSNVRAIHLSTANGTACQTFVLYTWVLPMGLRVKRSCYTPGPNSGCPGFVQADSCAYLSRVSAQFWPCEVEALRKLGLTGGQNMPSPNFPGTFSTISTCIIVVYITFKSNTNLNSAIGYMGIWIGTIMYGYWSSSCALKIHVSQSTCSKSWEGCLCFYHGNWSVKNVLFTGLRTSDLFIYYTQQPAADIVQNQDSPHNSRANDVID